MDVQEAKAAHNESAYDIRKCRDCDNAVMRPVPARGRGWFHCTTEDGDACPGTGTVQPA